MEQKPPDIIYAQIVAGKLCVSRKPNEVFGEQFQQYIRKDVFIDKLYKWLEEETSVADYYSEKRFKEVIDNLF